MKRRAIFLSIVLGVLVLLATLMFFALNVFKGKKISNNTLNVGAQSMASDELKKDNESNFPSSDVQSSCGPETGNKNVAVGGTAEKAKSSEDNSSNGGTVEKMQPFGDSSYKSKEQEGYSSQWNCNCSWNMVLLNDENSIPKGLVPPLKEYCGVKVNAGMISDLDAMIKSAKKDGINLWISSCYRSVEYQETLYNRKVKFYLDKGYKVQEAEKLARKVVAYPGTSEHNLGIAIDFNGVKDDFYTTKEFAWLKKHGPNYGFILRYDKNKQHITKKIYEPWHFRYVGKDAAQDIEQHDFCLEEYIQFLTKSNR